MKQRSFVADSSQKHFWRISIIKQQFIPERPVSTTVFDNHSANLGVEQTAVEKERRHTHTNSRLLTVVQMEK